MGDTTSDMSNVLRKYKIVILGEQSSKDLSLSLKVIVIWINFIYVYVIFIAGKTSLITRFVYDSFDSAYQVYDFYFYFY